MNEMIQYLRKRDDPDYYKKYYQKNKKRILEKNKEKIRCKCGKKVTRYNMSKHKKSETHKRIMKLISNLKFKSNF